MTAKHLSWFHWPLSWNLLCNGVKRCSLPILPVCDTVWLTLVQFKATGPWRHFMSGQPCPSTGVEACRSYPFGFDVLQSQTTPLHPKDSGTVEPVFEPHSLFGANEDRRSVPVSPTAIRERRRGSERVLSRSSGHS